MYIWTYMSIQTIEVSQNWNVCMIQISSWTKSGHVLFLQCKNWKSFLDNSSMANIVSVQCIKRTHCKNKKSSIPL